MNRIVMALSIAIVMLMVLSLSVGKASAENWMLWQYSAGSDDGAYLEYPKILGAFDSYAACKDHEQESL
ncbi:hypothetical protein [Geomobilimonas luticola]|uniref:Uncharacterized protein n=1 Tax=Geomobilimonas luticola TaxID=1114878 RepID=A0ABS5SEM8_9BACT|nr:hypothetical protein [Geomobilimonas luticola]MBT0653071.1 hypothetical protein [Geomobilimonas luticola]